MYVCVCEKQSKQISRSRLKNQLDGILFPWFPARLFKPRMNSTNTFLIFSHADMNYGQEEAGGGDGNTGRTFDNEKSSNANYGLFVYLKKNKHQLLLVWTDDSLLQQGWCSGAEGREGILLPSIITQSWNKISHSPLPFKAIKQRSKRRGCPTH